MDFYPKIEMSERPESSPGGETWQNRVYRPQNAFFIKKCGVSRVQSGGIGGQNWSKMVKKSSPPDRPKNRFRWVEVGSGGSEGCVRPPRALSTLGLCPQIWPSGRENRAKSRVFDQKNSVLTVFSSLYVSGGRNTQSWGSPSE